MRPLTINYWRIGIISLYLKSPMGQFNYDIRNYPFISQEKFAHEADSMLDSDELSNEELSRIRGSDLIYVRSDYIETLLDILGRNVVSKKIIVGGWPRDFTQKDMPLFQKFKKAYVQNLSVRAEGQVSALPLGLERPALGRNGNPALFVSKRSHKNGNILIGPFGPTHPEREPLLDKLDLQNVDQLRHRVTPRALEKKMRRASFVAAPRGSGIDTHRFWEALYRGATPIVFGSAWSDNMKTLGIPIVEIDNWTPDELCALRDLKSQVGFHPEKLPPIWWEYWKKRFKEGS